MAAHRLDRAAELLRHLLSAQSPEIELDDRVVVDRPASSRRVVVDQSGRGGDHPADVADGKAKADGQLLEPAILDVGGTLGGYGSSLRGRVNAVFFRYRVGGSFGSVATAPELLGTDHPPDLGDGDAVAGGELVEAAVLEG
jgi:hypothetical protein